MRSIRQMGRLGFAAASIVVATTGAQASPFEFEGFYAGVHAGYADSEADFSSGDLDGGAALGGVQFGYNFVSGNILYGVETDLSLSGVGPEGGCPYGGVSCEVNMGPMATLRGRLGYAVDDLVVYATGGIAGARFELQDSVGFDSDAGMLGWTVGAGVEHLIGDMVGVKLEYRYMQYGDFGRLESELEDPTGADIDMRMHVIMAGINFHF